MRIGKDTSRRRLLRCCVATLWASGLLQVHNFGRFSFSPLLFVQAQQQQQQQQQHQGRPDVECSPSQVDYDWQRWNYYELLGLARPSQPTASLDAKSIRKAYRKQAQLWHPDKQLVGNSNNNNSATDNSAAITKEEATARFAQIAHAYEVLSDDWKRKEYDLFLQYCENLLQEEAAAAAAVHHRPHWSKLFSNLRDPLRVFEEFLFGNDDDDDDDDEQDEDSWFFDMPPRNSEPIRITKHQDEFRDALTNEVIVRISQTEEYAVDASGRYYYRIVSQDFVRRIDPYTGGVALQPMTRPYLREEGSRNAKQPPQKEELFRQSLLFPGDVLTPKSALLVSPNRRYYAGLSPDCELIIMADHAFGEDTVVWTSADSQFASGGQSAPHNQPEYCFATLRGPHLVVALGRPEMPQRILWYSDAAGEEDDDNNGDTFEPGGSSTFAYYSSPSTYLAQLGNDGSLVVYKVWSPSPELQELPLSTRAWLATRQFWSGATRDDQYESLLLGSTTTGSRSYPHHFPTLSTSAATYKRCIFATGPLGCFRLVRRLYQLSLDIYFRLRSIMSYMDAMFDTWMDLIMEEDNYLQALKQSTSGIGSQIVSKSARLVRRILELVMLRGDK